ncbi:DNA-binding NtrC family response regulator [Balneicella halophila]|uniref:DNA-binding NtrC family response regulator n=1 Tax=Balneicella halophila TaxID=1537566 RepID=A0A7L4US37_BALHA|nr:sigma-54 dependent transcriptional regulator [Balneicella halophila]PVX52583.1 DNA-binding NtrC family response regulator [Balneicella halophila]
MPSILVVDDEQSIRRSLSDVLSYENYEISTAENALKALELIKKEDFDAVLCDIKMPEMDGIEALPKMLELKPDLSVIMLSGHGTIDTAVEAIKLGAYDFIEKPVDLNRLLVTLRNGLDKSNLITETKVLKKRVSKKFQIIGDSEPLNRIRDMIDKVAPTEARVLITGPNGSGKELVAHQIHEKSERSKAPFIEVNCAAIPSELIESELFGHEKGSFTSAHKQRKGKFELASEGTLFLDEIGDMSLPAQAKVLRALQENRITRVGGTKEIKVNPRVIAATNKNIEEEIKAKRFREDLYHRLSVILIQVPSLNDRKDDIPILAEHFINQICTEMKVPEKKIDKEAIKELQKLDWTGNIREFRNVIERLIILGQQTINKKDIQSFTRQ